MPREKWLAHIEASLCRPVLLIDEAQVMNSAVFCELRLLASADLDSRSLLAVILAGDHRLTQRLEGPTRATVRATVRPALCVVAQGAKVVMLGREVYSYDA